MDEPTTAGERACFEAGIKFGSLYHQFAGTPVSAQSAGPLETAIEASIRNQPYCRDVTVDIDEAAVAATSDEQYGYTELTGNLFDCRVEVRREGVEVVAEFVDREGYPEMTVTTIEDGSQ